MGLEPCVAGDADCVELALDPSGYVDAGTAEALLRSDVVGYGLGSQEFPLFLDHFLSKQRTGEVLLEVGHALSQVEQAPDGNYSSRVAAVATDVTEAVAKVIAAGGRVQLVVHCSTPKWLSVNPLDHNTQSGVREPSAQPVYACSMPSNLATWRAIMRGLADHFSTHADSITIVIGNEPDSYFVGERAELLTWYEQSVRGVLDSSAGRRYRVGGLTFVSPLNRRIGNAVPTLGANDKVTFAAREYDEPLTQSWIAHAGAAGLPIHVVTLHMTGGSPAPKETTYWNRARKQVAQWLVNARFDPSTVDLVIDDWPQWAPYASNDTEYFAAYTASGRISMLDSSLRSAGTVRMVQGFLMPFGFRPPGSAPSGFNGVPAMYTEFGVIKPVFNVHAMLGTMRGRITAVRSADPFVSAVAADDGKVVSILLSNHVPLEAQTDLLYGVYKETPILANDFGGNDVTLADVDFDELARVFYDGKKPSVDQLLKDALADPSRIDVSRLAWPDEAKTFFREAQRIGRLGRVRRATRARVDLELKALPAGSYRVEEFVVDASRANTYFHRQALDARVRAARNQGMARIAQEVRAITDEFNLESGQVRDAPVELGGSTTPLRIVMEPNSVHLLRVTRSD